MHGLSILALAIGATAAAVESCAPYCQFPKSITCPANGKTLTRDEIVAAAVNGNRSGPPYEESAANIATTHCSDTKFKGVPLYAASLPNSSGSLLYALDSKGTFYFCSTSSGTLPSGYPDSCKESN